MVDLIYLRMFGYVITLVLHIGNMLVIYFSMTDELMEDQDVRQFWSLQLHYITVWTFLSQTIYAALALACDVQTLKNVNKQDSQQQKVAKAFRDKLFVRFVWPASMLISSIFWPIYLYDREMVFPKFIDKVMHPISNHIMHTSIVPIALLEVVCQPRRLPKSHGKNLAHITTYFIIYLGVLFYTYATRGIWPYPILHQLYGTILLPLFFMIVFFLSIAHYYSQWCFVRLLWDSGCKQKVK